MNLQNLLNQFMGSASSSSAGSSIQTQGNTLQKTGGQIPGGLATGAAAGGIMALLMGNRSARKFAGKAATYGGAAVLGGLAYKALQNWQQDNAALAPGAQPVTIDESTFTNGETLSEDFQLKLVKAMIAAAKADGHIDEVEQQRIFNAVDQMQLSNDMKAMMFDLLRNPVAAEDLARGVLSVEQKSELYLVSCMAIEPDHPAELAHLDKLERSLELPQGLAQQLQQQVRQAMSAS